MIYAIVYDHGYCLHRYPKRNTYHGISLYIYIHIRRKNLRKIEFYIPSDRTSCALQNCLRYECKFQNGFCVVPVLVEQTLYIYGYVINIRSRATR